MLSQKFGIEIEMTGITRKKAAEAAAVFLSGEIRALYDRYGTLVVTATDGREWKGGFPYHKR